MSDFRTGIQGGTLSALHARQVALDNQLKKDSRAAAARCVEKFSSDHDWPGEDVTVVLQALGLIP